MENGKWKMEQGKSFTRNKINTEQTTTTTTKQPKHIQPLIF
jgi:hypothetical protein